jgi:hypothetical protein
MGYLQVFIIYWEVGLLQDRKIARYENPIGFFLLQTNKSWIFIFVSERKGKILAIYISNTI